MGRKFFLLGVEQEGCCGEFEVVRSARQEAMRSKLLCMTVPLSCLQGLLFVGGRNFLGWP